MASVHSKERPYRCQFCDQTFKLQANLNAHVKSVHISEGHKCKICQEEFENIITLRAHLKSHGKNKIYSCPLCEREFSKSSDVNRHVSAVHLDERPFQCDICSQRFKTSGNLNQHKQGKHQENPKDLKCKFCEKTFKYQSGLKTHEKRHLKQFVKFCEPCEQPFYFERDYDKHMLLKHSARTIPCTICDKKFATQELMLEHKLRHGRSRKPAEFHECPHCNKSYININAHIRDFHETNGKNYICDHCGKCFREKGSLKLHMMAHQGIRPHQCNICDKSFVTKQHLIVHTRLHTGETPYKCKICGSGFAQMNKFNIHLALHSGKKPFKCDICSMGFYDKRYLKRHNRVKHSEDE